LAGVSDFHISPAELTGGLSGIRRADREHEIPDPINFEDWAMFPESLEELMARRGWRPSGRPPRHRISHWTPFPYPKLIGRPRDLADLHLADRLVTHSVVARIGAHIDQSLSRRMYANRLARSGPNWQLAHFRNASRAYRDDRLRSLADHMWPYTLITDVSSYYPSISRERLVRRLRAIPCEGEAIDTLEELLTTWQTRDGLQGLPMGQQPFGVIAAPMMGPADAMMERWAADHFIYGDDITMFATDAVSGSQLRSKLEELLGDCGLVLNLDKTTECYDPMEAWDALENDLLASLGVLGRRDPDLGLERARLIWDELAASGPVTEPHRLAELHSSLAWMGNHGDTHAAGALVGRRDLLQLSPKATFDYLMKVSVDDLSIAADVSDIASTPVTPTTAAMVLHALRFTAARQRPFVGSVCERLLDIGAYTPVRAWAAFAHSRTSNWSCADTLERAEAESNFWVTRSLLASTRDAQDHVRLRGRFLKHIAPDHPDLAAVAAWVTKPGELN